jgi:hypothetical protein
MNELELKDEQLRAEISMWMSHLFDNDVRTDDVKAHVTSLTKKIVSTQLKNTKVTLSVFKDLCKAVEDDFK